jgi:hypothetical protein
MRHRMQSNSSLRTIASQPTRAPRNAT